MAKQEDSELRLQSAQVTVIDIAGKTCEYDVCEFAGDQDEAFFDEGREHADITEVNGKTKVVLKSFRGIRMRLLKRTVRQNGELVPEEQLQQLTARSQKKLYDTAQRVCGLGTSAEEDAKNA